MECDFINTIMPIKVQDYNHCFSFMIDKLYLPEYISNNPSSSGELNVKEELSTVSREDEGAVILYLLNIMRAHDIITEEEYQAVLYKYN